tara:strand:+ start:13170 stop:13703 length:534 start_codon:yes stop_codon:yes gene_type:complete
MIKEAMLAAVLGVACVMPGCVSADPVERADAGGAHAALAPFGVLEGVWRTTDGEFEEVWMAPAGENMTGAMRRVRPSGRADLFELLTLTPEPDGVRLRLRHFDAALNPWKSEAGGPAEFVADGVRGGVMDFVNPAWAEDAGGVRLLRYDLSEPGRMTVTLDTGPGREPFVLAFERVR